MVTQDEQQATSSGFVKEAFHCEVCGRHITHTEPFEEDRVRCEDCWLTN